MVNFRFHLVSLTAVFLALAAGIAIGAGVVDRQTVAFLEARLDEVETNREQTNEENVDLREQLSVWNRFSDEAGTRVVEGRLPDVPIVLMGVEGVDRNMVGSLRETYEAAGALVQGSVWFTGRWALESDDDIQRLAELTGVAPTIRPDDLRRLAIDRLVTTWTAGALAEIVVPLRDDGFIEFDPPPGQDTTLEGVAMTGAAVTVVAGEESEVDNRDLGLPLVTELAEAGLDVLVAQRAPKELQEGEEAPPAGLALVVRGEDIAGEVSSIDNLDDYRGRIGAVLVVNELRQGRTGHYGTADGAQRLLPEPPA